MGNDAIFFDRDMIENLKDNMFWWRVTWVYRSNWRALHIDGLEGCVYNPMLIPESLGGRIQFFNYKVETCAKPS